jgi:NAD dependent epimerase/dehydratase family enzyme
MLLAALEDERFSGAVNATAPQPVSNREFARTLARVLRRPALLPVPRLALRGALGEMSEVLTTGQRALPAKALVAGFEFRHPTLDGALRSVLGSG